MRLTILILGVFLVTVLAVNGLKTDPQPCAVKPPPPCNDAKATSSSSASASSKSGGASSSSSSSSSASGGKGSSTSSSSSGSSASSGKGNSSASSSSGSSASSGKGNSSSSSSSGSSASNGKGNASSASSSGSSASSGKGNSSSSSSSGSSASSGKGNASSSSSSGSSASSGKGNSSSASSSGSSASSGKGNASSASSSGSSASSGKGNSSSSSSSGSSATNCKDNSSASSSSGSSASSGKGNSSSSSSSGSSASSGKGNASSASSSGSSASSGKGNSSSSSSSGSSASSGKGNASSASSSGSSASSGKGNSSSSSSSGSSASSGKGNASSASSSGSSASSGKGNSSSSSSSGSSASSGKGNASSASSSGSSASSGKESSSSSSSSGSSASSGKGKSSSSSSSGSSATSGKGNTSSASSSGSSASSGKESSSSSSSSASSGKGNSSSSSSSGSSATSGKGNASSASSSGSSASSGKESSSSSSSSASSGKGNSSSSSSSGSSASSGKGNASSASSSGSSASSGKGNSSSASSSGSSASSGKGNASSSSSSSSSSFSSSSGSSSSLSSSSSSASGGVCKTTKAPKDCCGVNEEWTECAGPCPPQPTCVGFGKPSNCIFMKVACVAGCTCKKGYFRNSKNKCVKPDQCENNLCPALNEQYSSCVSPCGETCATMGKDLVCNFLECNEGCDCKPGFFRNSTGSCVEPRNCDCPDMEYLNLNYLNCPPQTCDAIGKQFKCPEPNANNTKPACSCYSWMKRNDQGKCVQVEECPPLTCTKKNEVYSYQWWCFKEKCGSEDEPCPDTYYDVAYEPVCTCKRPDFCRDAGGECVENTGTNRCPDPNTVYKECAKPTWYQTCVARGKDYGEITWCERGCECLPGMYRNRENKCVPEEECECPINEYFDECQWYRRPESCEDIYTPYVVSYPIDTSNCTKGCICDWGFYRNCEGKCVPVEQCPNYKCTSSEYYNSCSGDYECENCGDDCGFIAYATDSVAARSGAPSASAAGRPASLAADRVAAKPVSSGAEALGYIAQSSKQGGPQRRAPAAAGASLSANPVESAAASAKLSVADSSLRRPWFYSYTCTPKCVCKWDEYCRAPCGECIKNEGPDACPKENTQFSKCRIQSWIQSCEMREEKQYPNDYCQKGCECLEGYYRNTTNACVASEDCECPVREYYGCNDDCQPKTCEDLFKNYEGCYDKIDWNTWTCNQTCLCNYNKFRDCSGTCVNLNECPCPDPNAEMVECPYRCGGGSCDDPVIKTDCNDYCNWYQRYGCQCKPGFVRKSLTNPECIPLDHCPKKCKK